MSIAAILFQVVFSGGITLDGGISITATSSGDPQTPVATIQAIWVNDNLPADPWGDGAASPTAAGNSYLPYAPNKSVLTR